MEKIKKSYILSVSLIFSFLILSLCISSVSAAPNSPVNIFPSNGATNISLTPTLQASRFADQEPGTIQTASQWEIISYYKGVNNPVSFSIWEGGPEASARIPEGKLESSITYYWHVKYQDSRGEWSPWSKETYFTTVSQSPVKLVPQPVAPYSSEKPTRIPTSASINIKLNKTSTESTPSPLKVSTQSNTLISPATTSETIPFSSQTKTGGKTALYIIILIIVLGGIVLFVIKDKKVKPQTVSPPQPPEPVEPIKPSLIKESVPPVIEPAPAVTYGEKTKCSFCGAEIKKESKFCTNCGKQTIQEKEDVPIMVKICPYCGKQNKAGNKFCVHCGNPFVIDNNV